MSDNELLRSANSGCGAAITSADFSVRDTTVPFDIS